MLFSRFELQDVGVAGGGEPNERFTFVMAPHDLRLRLRVRPRAAQDQYAAAVAASAAP